MSPEISSTTIETTLGPLMLHRTGSGEPVLLWHSLFVDSRTFTPFLDVLGQRREVFLVDGPGHGGSPGPRRLYSMVDCAVAAGQILDAVGVSAPVDWVGNAWGGHVGIVFAHRFPDRCRTLVTIGTPAYPLSLAERLQLTLVVYLYRLAGPGPFRRLISDALLGKDTARAVPSAANMVQAAFCSGDKRGKYWAMQSVMLHRPDLRPVLPRLTVPTLMLSGKDDPMNDPKEAERAAHSIPAGGFETVTGAGHVAPLLIAPAELTQLILQFWQQNRTRQRAI